MRFILCVCFNYTQKLFIHLSLLLTTCLSVKVQRPTAMIPDFFVLLERQFNLHSLEC